MSHDSYWMNAPLPQLVDHIVASHHAHLHRELPLLGALLADTMRAHWRQHPELMQAHTLYNATRTALDQHLMQEETAGFPLIRAHERDRAVSPAPFTGTIDAHHQVHAEAEAGFRKLRATLWDGTAPGDVPAGDALIRRLDALIADLTIHIHLENDILFARVQRSAADASGRQTTPA